MLLTITNKCVAFLKDKVQSSTSSKNIGSSTTLIELSTGDLERFIAQIDAIPDIEEKKRVLTVLLFTISRMSLDNHQIAHHLFLEGEKFGVHLLPAHFYSPVPNLGSLSSDHFAKEYDLKLLFPFDDKGLLDNLTKIKEYSFELRHLPWDLPSSDANGFYFGNSQFGLEDTTVYYGLIRSIKPKRILEVGAGFSTLLAIMAATKNANDCHIQCVEPYPRDFLKTDSRIELIQKPVQEASIALFNSLEAGDILFIDNTHVSKIGSDVNDIFFRVLPSLKKGVYVHIHDIFLPNEYPEYWVRDLKLFWNEQHMLLAYLSHNKDFEAVMLNAYVSKNYPIEMTASLPVAPRTPVGGGSFWIKKVS